MHSINLNKKEIKEIRNEIKKDFAQRSSSNDRMLDLDDQISIFGDEIETRDQFARDRDRIIYCTAFRRLEHKAQVYSHEKGDHYRTRLTHTLEVTQIARGIAKNLGLNEDLTEAIALGHDIGHTPFGHAGEEVLDKIMRGEDDLGGKLKYKLNYGGFKHNFHSLKILDILERKYEDGKGLNLTWQVLEGILKHTKIKKPGKTWDLNRFIKNKDFFKPLVPNDTFFKYPTHKIDFEDYAILESPLLNVKSVLNFENSLTLEGQVVAIADEIAQRQHDLDDGLRDLELRMDESDVLIDTEKIIDTILEEIILEKIVRKININRSLYPITFLLDGLMEIVGLLKLILNSNDNFDELIKRVKDILPVNIIKEIFLEEYYNYLDDDIKLLWDLKGLIRKSNVKGQDFKWNNRRRNVISYFIHDVTRNTMKNIKERKYISYKKNLYRRKENFEYFVSKKNYTNCSALLDYKRFWNRRSYFMTLCVCFSHTAAKFNEKIEHYIENRIINSYNVNRFDGKAKFILRQLFKAYYENPKQMNKTQLSYLSRLIDENMDNYYELKFSDGTKVRNIKFDSTKEGFVLNLKDVSRLINLLKLEVRLENLNDPGITLDLEFLNEISGSMAEVSQKWGYFDKEAFKLIIFDEILKKINEMDKDSIMKEEDEEKRNKLLFIKCLIENHYSYLSVICDYIAGMTDNYANSEYKKLYLV